MRQDLNPFAQAWADAESSAPRPERARNLLRVNYHSFRDFVWYPSPAFVRNTVASLYAGDIHILKNAFSKLFMRILRRKAMEYCRSKPSAFYKMLEGCPDFHRIIDLETGKKYSFQVCKHSSFFYPWNDDPLNLFGPIYQRWRVIKWLMGLKPTAYEKNTPKDGVVDRIQIAQYPSKIGFLEPHSDPYLHQRLFLSGYMSKRGVDYQGGGFYVVGRNDQMMEVEDEINVGDIGIGYATIYHGVAPCNRHLEPDWESDAGRWFLSMYSNASDEKPDRHTGHPVKLKLEGVTP